MVTMFSLLFVYIFTKSVLEKNRSTLFYTGKAKQRCIALAIHSSDNNRKKKKLSINPFLDLCQNNFLISYKAVFEIYYDIYLQSKELAMA